MSVDRREGELAEKLKGPVTTLRIIIGALATGVLVFAVGVLVVRSGREAEPEVGTPLLTWMAIGAAPLALVASRVLPAIMAGGMRRQIEAQNGDSSTPRNLPPGLAELGDAGPLCMVYQTKTIIGAAVLEGAAFLSIMAFLIEGAWIALGIGVGLAGVILTMFPSATHMADWVEQQMRRCEEERQLGR